MDRFRSNCRRADCRTALFVVFSILSLVSHDMAGHACEPVQPHSPARELRNIDLLDQPAPEFEHYYILVFGSQKTPRLPRYTHTWATMVRTFELPGEPPVVREVHTISWMPASGVIRPMRFRVEPGQNLDLCESISNAQRQHQRIALWGPYETWPGLYRRFVTQSVFLASGEIGYQCIDGFGEAARFGNGCNCFHAISDMDPEFDRHQYPLFFYGDPASANIVRQIMTRPVLIRPYATHDWLIGALGLGQTRISRRRYKGPMVEFSPQAVRARVAIGGIPFEN